MYFVIFLPFSKLLWDLHLPSTQIIFFLSLYKELKTKNIKSPNKTNQWNNKTNKIMESTYVLVNYSCVFPCLDAALFH